MVGQEVNVVVEKMKLKFNNSVIADLVRREGKISK